MSVIPTMILDERTRAFITDRMLLEADIPEGDERFAIDSIEASLDVFGMDESLPADIVTAMERFDEEVPCSDEDEAEALFWSSHHDLVDRVQRLGAVSA